MRHERPPTPNRFVEAGMPDRVIGVVASVASIDERCIPMTTTENTELTSAWTSWHAERETVLREPHGWLASPPCTG